MLKFIKNNSTKLLLALYIILPLAAALKQYLNGSFNNYLIFKYTFINTTNGQGLFQEQPQYFFDSNHYGPFFALIFAPFAMLPDFLGIPVWALFVSLTLYYAIRKLPVSEYQQNLILLICSHELLTSLFNLQSNAFIAALIILTFVFSLKHNEILSGLLIAIGFLIKLYGIVGFAFILFATNKVKYIASFLIFTVLLALLPALISSVPFQIQGYHDWYISLSTKNSLNLGSVMQNISVIGLIQKNINADASTRNILLCGLLMMLAQVLVNYKRFNNTRFQLLLLSSVLLFTVLFSTGSESATYIIAFPGVAIWYVTKEKKTYWDHFLLAFAIILTSFSPSDLFPPDARTFVREYKLKALPCFLIWLEILRESYFDKPKAAVND
ncbi:glycosyltransferase family 87 protein [Pedobacter sp. P351]|uniref:glycosyltransferase family 87 protein n=1 Tax=Pedobacter superstes TaxID=3133441 RepID=UPI003097EBA4